LLAEQAILFNPHFLITLLSKGAGQCLLLTLFEFLLVLTHQVKKLLGDEGKPLISPGFRKKSFWGFKGAKPLCADGPSRIFIDEGRFDKLLKSNIKEVQCPIE